MTREVITLEVEICEFWHAGSGRSRGPVLDAEVVRTAGGLPYLPGRTLRGLCREGVEQAIDFGLLETHGAASIFGESAGVDGTLAFDDATLGADYEQWAAHLDDPAVVESLYVHLASTQIDPESGQARDKTLRVIEAAVPLTLRARVFVHEDAPSDVRRILDTGLGFIRGLGTNRRRGLGRARIRRVEERS